MNGIDFNRLVSKEILLQFFSKLDPQVSDDIKASKEIIGNKDLIIWVSVRMQLHYKDTEQYVSK